MPSLAPGGEITTALGTLARMKESFGGLRFRGEILYQDEPGTAYTSPVDIDLGVYESLTYLSRKGLHEIGTELEKIRTEINHLATGFSKPTVLTQDVKLYRQEQAELFEHAQKELQDQKKPEQEATESAPSAHSEEQSA
jgi:hypothetical protein